MNKAHAHQTMYVTQKKQIILLKCTKKEIAQHNLNALAPDVWWLENKIGDQNYILSMDQVGVTDQW